jgi:myosin heavy subunit
MSRGKTKATLVWVSGFLSFVAGLNMFNSIVLMTLRGSDSIIDFSLSTLHLGSLSALSYLLVSITITFVLLGVTFFSMFQGLPVDSDVLQRLSKVEEGLGLSANMLENMQIGFFRRLEDNEKATDQAIQRMSISLEEARKQTNDSLENQKKALQNAQKESQKNADVIEKHASQVAALRKHVRRIEKALSPSKAKLTSNSRLDSVKGVKPSLADGMRNMGIANVGQFLITDPAVIAEKTTELHETVTNLQARAQLLMVPSVDANDAELLVKAGITSRKELAEQDPVQLCRAIANVANTYVETGKMSASRVPTVDDVWSWIRSAKS